MSQTRFVLTAATGIGLAVLCVGEAWADTAPSTWDFAKDPTEQDRWALHVRVERLIAAGSSHGLDGGQLRLEAARAMLEEADAAHSPDVRLRFDLGVVYGRLELRRKAIEILVPALAEAPDHPAAREALDALVYSYAKLDRPSEELATWNRLIPLISDDRARANATMNMGEAQMRLGWVDEAVETFRDVLRLSGELPNTGGVSSTYVLTLWDLAVALDRSGDPRGALDAAARASAEKAGRYLITRDPDVFFVPDWEREWYLALGAAAAARDAKDARDEATLWSAAEKHWASYIERSTESGRRDPWLAVARLRHDNARTRRQGAERRSAGHPPRAAAVGTWSDD
jgi:tetratricopeptide (TPR) repeat protein